VELLGTMQRRFCVCVCVCVCERASAREMWRMMESEVMSGTRADGMISLSKEGACQSMDAWNWSKSS
jgi:hypothetical protein